MIFGPLMLSLFVTSFIPILIPRYQPSLSRR